MTPFALALIVLAGLIHAVWNIVAKKAGGDARFAFFTSIAMMVFWAPVGIWLGWDQVPLWGSREWTWVVASGGFHVLYYIVLLRGYRKSDLTVVYPMARGSGPLLSSLTAVVLLGERLNVTSGFGIAAVVLGVFLVAGGPRLFRRVEDAQKRQMLNAGLRYGLLTGVLIASYTVVDGYSVKVLMLSPVLVEYFGNLVRILLLAPSVLRAQHDAWKLWQLQWREATFIGIVSPVSYVLVLFAMQAAPLSHVAPAREVSMLFAALLGGHLLNEGDRLGRFVGALCIALGVMALALG